MSQHFGPTIPRKLTIKLHVTCCQRGNINNTGKRVGEETIIFCIEFTSDVLEKTCEFGRGLASTHGNLKI